MTKKGDFIYFKSNERDKFQENGHFWAYEFACRSFKRFGKITENRIHIQLLEVLEELRSRLGNKPLKINSGYRTNWYNTWLKNQGYPASSRSQHLYGKAADIQCPIGVTPEEMRDIAEELIGNNGGVGVYDWGIHIDTRGYAARWDYRSNSRKRKYGMNIENTEEKLAGTKKSSWLSKQGSGKKLSAILWILTFAFCIFPYALYMVLNYLLMNNGANMGIDSNIMNTWADLMGVWITGLIWFSGFITFGSTAKKFFTQSGNKLKTITDSVFSKVNTWFGIDKQPENHIDPPLDHPEEEKLTYRED